MGRIGPVRVVKVESPLSVELVSNYTQGVGICCGGYTSGGSSDELSPIKDAKTLLICRAYEAQRLAKIAEQDLVRQRQDFKVYAAAVRAFDDIEVGAQ